MDAVNATREIFWQIPFSYKVAMYVFFFVALGIMAKGLYEKYQYIKEANNNGKLLPEKLNWKRFLDSIFFTGKVTRDGYVGFYHSLIYYGFMILLIATELVAIHADTPMKPYQGTTYIIISFLADFAGVALLVGLAFAYKRRYIDKPDYLKATKPYRELFMYGMLFSLVFLGYVIEGLRIYGAGMPEGEQVWSPVGWLIASFIGQFSMSDQALTTTYRGLWMFHMLNTMVFIASISYSKFLHIIAAPFAALVTPARRGAVMTPMDFEDETAETFGLGKKSEMTPKMRLDALACVECGRCTQVCPANLAGKPLDPKTIITKMRDATVGTKEDVDFWEKNLYSPVELDSCTTCGACMEECPVNIEHIQEIMGLKRYKALTLGEIPPEAATAV
ncbi:MAG: (Fe-S)-binding protein, partial [Bacteriovoracaceae bacterium]